ncbi:MAG TPA: sulfatase-like hydrolase/transferase [Candidatus Limnocylindrales bacterium]|nr:sulfatase-like hydrolase/transferase [Candidatus Limnocylindrales bacterium]
MKRAFIDHGLSLLAGGILMTGPVVAVAQALQATPPRTDATGKPPYNIILVIVDQRSYRLFAGSGYSLPAINTLARHGVTFRNHYTASAMCSPSRAALLTGQPPQVNGVLDQMEYSFVSSLSTNWPNIGSVLKELAYKTAYFGKFEMDKDLLKPNGSVNYSAALLPYGFDQFNAVGDIGSAPESGFDNDAFIAGESVSWLRANAPEARRSGQPFLLVASFVNPHDVMYANANVPGQPPVQKAVTPRSIPPLPSDATYDRKWSFTFPASLQESLTAPGIPNALLEYQQGWSGWSGIIPTDRKDMWGIFYNYYLNTIRDNDRSLQQVVDAMNDMDLWRDTVIIYTSDHGEMAGAHGGLKGKGPFAYEANVHVPLIIAHPSGKPGSSCSALTSHLDLLPTIFGLTGLPESRRPAAVKALPGHDFSALLANPQPANAQTVRPGVLFNYLGLSTIDGDYLRELMSAGQLHQATPPVTQVNLDKRGYLSFVFDGRYKFGRYYAPNAFNTPKTLEEIFKYNDIQLFDLENDPDEMHNLALTPKRNQALILRMNGLLNNLMAKEVGIYDGRTIPQVVGSK